LTSSECYDLGYGRHVTVTGNSISGLLLSSNSPEVVGSAVECQAGPSRSESARLLLPPLSRLSSVQAAEFRASYSTFEQSAADPDNPSVFTFNGCLENSVLYLVQWF
jgi:hypothetical protein